MAGQNGVLWRITGENIGDRVEGDAFCNGLWDNLHCAVWPQIKNCKSHGNRGLLWEFVTSDFCGGSEINAAWWRATKNGFGDLQC